MTHLERSIDDNKNPGDIKKLTEELKTNMNLTELDMANSLIRDRGAIALATALQTNKYLKVLLLPNNSIGEAGAIKLATALQTNKETALTTLELYNNYIRDAGAMAFATLLQTNKTLRTLDLRCIGMEVAGSMAIAEALQTNTTLTSLLLGDNTEVAGSMAIAKALQKNTSLTTLDLSFNGIKDGEAGAIGLATALRTNKSLTTLYLAGNRIGEAGAIGLARVLLQKNTTLTTLDLHDNGIGVKILENISFRIRYNSLLKKWREIIKDKTEYKDGERQTKIYDTLHKDATKLLEDEYIFSKKYFEQIFTYKERKLIFSWIQHIKSSSDYGIGGPLADFFIHVMNKTEEEEEGHKDKKPKNDTSSMDVPENDHWKEDWIVDTTHDGQTIYKPKQKNHSSMDEVDFLPKKRRSVNRKKSSKQKRVIKSRIGKKSKRGSVHKKKVKKSPKVSVGRKSPKRGSSNRKKSFNREKLGITRRG